MIAIATAELVRLVKPVATVAGKTFVQRARQPFQIAARASSEASSQGVSIPKRQIRKLLKSAPIADLLTRPSGDVDVDQAVNQIAWTMPGDNSEDRHNSARVVVNAIFWGYLWTLNPAVAQSYSRLDDKLDYLANASVAERARADARVSFEDNLQAFPPSLREEAEALRSSWPRIESIVAELANPATRNDVIGQWADVPPKWLTTAPAMAWAWLALVAAGHRRGQTSLVLWKEAMAQGYFPRGVALGYAALSQAVRDEAGAQLLLDEQQDDHPFYLAARAALAHDPVAVVHALEQWTPTEAAFRPQKDVMTAAAYLERKDVGEAITRATQAWLDYQSTAAALLAARGLLLRAQEKTAVARIPNAEAALDLAMKARDKRHEWGGDSAEAVELAVIALHLLHNPERVWVLTQVPPAGEATAEEAGDQRIIVHAALAAALTGRTDAAREYAARLVGFPNAHVEAVVAEWEGDAPAAESAWRRASDLATNDLERIQAANGLVHAGGPVPDLGSARETYPEVAAELDTLAEALGSPDPITFLRARATASPIFLVELARRLREGGKHGEAAQALDDGATRWSDPVLAAMAAREFVEHGFDAEGIAAARHALDIGGPNWSGRRQMLATIIDAEAGRQHWGDAATAARQMLTETPGDVDAQWALASAYYNSAEPEKAWDSLTLTGRPLRPRRRSEVMLWLRLGSRFSTDAKFVDDAFEIMRDWFEDESVFGTFVQVMIAPGNLQVEVSDAQAQGIRDSVEAFTQKFPASQWLRAVPIGADENPLEPMSALLREGAERHADAADQARRGTIPLGLLSVIANRTYAEASLRRAANGVLAEFVDRPADEVNAAARAADATCVLDATAAHTLVLLDERLRSLLLGTCASLATTDSSFRDAVAARESLRLQSTMTVGWDTNTDRPIVSEVSEEQAASLAEQAEQLVAVMTAARREPHTTLSHFPKEFDRAQPSLGLIDFAKSNGYVLWSDDRVLRRVAASMGVDTFGTVVLLGTLLQRAKMTPEEHAASLATLVSNYYSDITFTERVYTLASQMDGAALGGAAHALSRPAIWSDPEATLGFALSRLRTASASAPQDVRALCVLTTTGLLAIATGDPDGCANNLVILLSRCMRESWCTSAALPFVLTGIRDAVQASGQGPLRDPLEAVLRVVHEVASRQLGDADAKAFLLELVSQCGTEDKQTAARVILTAPRR